MDLYFTIIKVRLFRPAYVLIVYAFINNNNNINLVYAFIPIRVFSCIPIINKNNNIVNGLFKIIIHVFIIIHVSIIYLTLKHLVRP